MIIRLKTGEERAAVRPYRSGPKQTLYKSALWARAGCAGSIGMALTRESAFLSVDALPEPLEATRVRKVPTGIADLDSIVDGGLPSGSTILLCGDVGAGMQEYIYTAASKTALVHERPEARHYYLGDRCDDSDVPDRVCYVTFSRSKEIILQELATSFNGDYYRAFRDHTVFKDFSSTYFRHSVVPASWTARMAASCSSGGRPPGRATASDTCISRSSPGSSRICRGTRSPGSRRWSPRTTAWWSSTWSESREAMTWRTRRRPPIRRTKRTKGSRKASSSPGSMGSTRCSVEACPLGIPSRSSVRSGPARPPPP